MRIGFIGLGIMGSRMAANLKNKASPLSSSTGLVRRRKRMLAAWHPDLELIPFVSARHPSTKTF
jgi:3-hydroxyisobutyrate dehydrogenase-like beta-hydroxyacid dehydrogenase